MVPCQPSLLGGDSKAPAVFRAELAFVNEHFASGQRETCPQTRQLTLNMRASFETTGASQVLGSTNLSADHTWYDPGNKPYYCIQRAATESGMSSVSKDRFVPTPGPLPMVTTVSTVILRSSSYQLESLLTGPQFGSRNAKIADGRTIIGRPGVCPPIEDLRLCPVVTRVLPVGVDAER